MGDYAPFERPDRVTASTAESCSQVEVSWNPAEGATTYKLFRDGTDDPADVIYEGSDTYFVDTPPANPSYPQYSYKVRAYNGCQGHTQSAYAGYGTLKLTPDPIYVYATTNECSVVVSWSPWLGVPGFETGPAEGYKVYRTEHDNPAMVTEGDLIEELEGTYLFNDEYHDYPPLDNHDYYYWVRAGVQCNSGWSWSDLDLPALGRRAECAPASPPSNLQASDGQWCDEIRLTWTDAASGTHYVVRNGVRLPGEVGFGSYNDTDVVAGHQYEYAVEACHAGCSVCVRSNIDVGWGIDVPAARQCPG